MTRVLHIRHFARVVAVVIGAIGAIATLGGTAHAQQVSSQNTPAAGCATDTLTVGFPQRWLGTRIGQVTVDAHTVEAPSGWIGSVVRALHFTTRLSVPLNNLTFAAGQVMDSLEIQESIRRLRRSGVYNDVMLTGVRCADGTTDLQIMTRDSWSLRGDVRYGRVTSRVSVSEMNLGGSGRSLSAVAENVDDRAAVTFTYNDPYLFGSRLRGGLSLRNYGDGRSWGWNIRSRDFSPRDVWRMSFTSSQLMRQQLDVTQPVALLIDRRSDVLTFQRRIQQDGDGVTALVFGVEQEKAALDVVQRNARLGRPSVARDFSAPLVGFARRSMQVGAIDWLVPGQPSAEVPHGFDGEFVVGVGHDFSVGGPITHFDSWGGYTAQPDPATILTGDLWLSGYFENDSVADGVARVAAAAYRRARGGSWALRVAAERVLNPDPDVFALSTVDPTLRALIPSSRLAESAVNITLERSLTVYTRDRRWAVDAVPFLQYTERHRNVATNDTLTTNPEALLIGVGIRRVWGQPSQSPIRFDIAKTIWMRGSVSNRWLFTLTTQPWFNISRRRQGGRDLNNGR